jgi:uncharacterized repeat protein (TIGR01451 family)
MAMVFSTVAIADTQTKETTPELYTTGQGSANGARGAVVWDNGMDWDIGLMSAQMDEAYPYDCFVADDFHFEADTEVTDVHWIGGYWNGDPAEFDWCISFYMDDGSGEAPAGMPYQPTFAGPYCFAWSDIEIEDLGNQYYSMSVDLPETLTFAGCEKYWISIWGYGLFPPQSGWAAHYDYQLSPCVWGSNFWGYVYWTPGFDIQGFDHDLCFQLTGPEACDPSIDLEKEVQDEDGVWQQADTRETAVDLPICNTATFRITIKNTGNCPLFNIVVKDIMHDSLEYTSSDPEGEVYYEEPNWIIEWYFEGPLAPGDAIVIYVTAHVAGEDCSIDENKAVVDAVCEHGTPVNDADSAFVHCYKKSIDFNRPFLSFLESHTNMFPLLQKLLHKLGLF